MSWQPPRNRSGSRCASCGPTTSSGPASTSSPRWPGRPTPTRPPGGCSRTRRTSAPRSWAIYGQAAGDRLTELLKEHIMIAVDLVAAAKSGDQAAFATHDARWTANIEAIAAFLAGANPNWPEKDVLDLLALHLKLTKDEAVARITRRLGGRRQGVRRHLHRDHGPRRRAPRRDRRAVPRALRRRRQRHDAARARGGVARAGDPPDRRRRVRPSRGCWAPTAAATASRASPTATCSC